MFFVSSDHYICFTMTICVRLRSLKCRDSSSSQFFSQSLFFSTFLSVPGSHQQNQGSLIGSQNKIRDLSGHIKDRTKVLYRTTRRSFRRKTQIRLNLSTTINVSFVTTDSCIYRRDGGEFGCKK